MRAALPSLEYPDSEIDKHHDEEDNFRDELVFNIFHLK